MIIDDSKSFDIEVSLEELIVNSFSHGDSKGEVLITAQVVDGELRVELNDCAPPFNLLREAPPPPAETESIKDRKIGSLGICLVKNLSDRIEYSGSPKGNKVTLFKSLKK